MQKTETKTLVATALAIDKLRVPGTWNDSPGHAALGLALVRAVIFAILKFYLMLRNIQVWWNYWRK